MNNKNDRFEIEDIKYNFSYNKKRSEIKIDFNRVAFIFFILILISIIFSIHLLHLGSRQSKVIEKNKNDLLISELYRADIVDRNNNFLVKTVRSIDVGINPLEIIDEKKLLLNLKYIFPEKNYEEVKKRIDKNKFRYNLLINHIQISYYIK